MASKKKVVKRAVTVRDDKGVRHNLLPGDEVPKELEDKITNEKVFEEDNAPERLVRKTSPRRRPAVTPLGDGSVPESQEASAADEDGASE